MKKLKLKRWVKVVSIILVIGALMIVNIKITNEAVNQCVNAGNDYNYCVEGLK